MPTTFSSLPPSVQALVAETFSALDEAEAWTSESLGQHAGTGQSITFAELYDFAMDPSADSNGRVRAELRRNGPLARNFAALLDRLNAFSMPAQAAAAAGTFLERVDDATGIRVRLIESAAATREMHLVIEIGDIAPGTIRVLYVLPRDGGCETLALDEDDGGLIHMLLERDTELLKHLMDPSTELKFK
jgi:hypothetical protein